jgi:hypothetical protein
LPDKSDASFSAKPGTRREKMGSEKGEYSGEKLYKPPATRKRLGGPKMLLFGMVRKHGVVWTLLCLVSRRAGTFRCCRVRAGHMLALAQATIVRIF